MGLSGVRPGRLLGAFAVLLTAYFPASATAQNYDNPGLGEQPVVAHPQDYKPLGIRMGAFMLHPGAQLAAEYNDNVFYTAEDEVDDTIWHFRPYLTTQSNWNRHALNVRLAADVARYQDNGIRDYEDYFLSVNGRVDVQTRSMLTYALDYMNLHEDLNTRSAEQGREPTRFDLYGGTLGYDHTFNRLSVALQYRMHWLNFDDAVGRDGSIIRNQDRDRRQSDAMLRAGYQFQTDKQAFVSVIWHDVAYDDTLDRNGYDRSSDGYTANAGLKFTLTGKLDGDVFVSYHDQSYDDPVLPDVDGWAGGAGLHWQMTQLTSVAARIASSVEQTTNRYSSGYLGTLYSLRVDHELLRNVQLSGHVSYRDNNYQLIDGAPETARDQDKVWQTGLGVSYFVNRYVFFSAAYTHSRLRSGLPEDEYDANRIWLTLSLER